MEWNVLDRFIANIRYRKIDKYIPRGGVICDVGCGRDAKFLKRHSSEIKMGYGLDFRISDSSLDNIKLLNNKEMKQFPIETDSCDAVFMIAVLEHLDNPLEMLSNIHNILVPGGQVVLTTPTPLAKPILEFMAFKLHIINEEEILEHKHYYCKEEIFDLLTEVGFLKCSYRKFCFGVNSIIVAKKE